MDKNNVQKVVRDANVYMHFETKCLKQFDESFSFDVLVVSEKVHGKMTDDLRKRLRSYGVSFE